jgi:hypothetical protein
MFPAGRAGDTRAAICAISCFVRGFRVCVCVCSYFVGALERRKRVSTQSPVPFFPVHFWRVDQLLSGRGPQESASPVHKKLTEVAWRSIKIPVKNTRGQPGTAFSRGSIARAGPISNRQKSICATA